MKAILVSFLICFFSLQAFALTEIGQVIVAYGNVEAVRKNSEAELLSKGSPIYLDDQVQVALDSFAQIRFTDGTLINLIADTHYRIDQYRYKTAAATNLFSSELLKGGMRAFSGKISKENPDEATLKTPHSVIGIRGTIFEVLIAKSGTFFGCESGEIRISNQAGVVAIGPKASQQFGFVTSADSLPQTFNRRPDVLNLSRFIPSGNCR